MNSENKKILDTKGLNCPLPLLKTKKALLSIAKNEILEIYATDPGAEKDLKNLCEVTKYKLISFRIKKDGTYIFQITKND
ncbi:MAG: sulfurtransferase TusA family protein [Pseudomonadota bacterium]|nr:sulfurtransferase TusA family protein [Pseudomonadota bacterium]